jgi:hypothetical protein
MDILILGSTQLTELCVNKLKGYYNLVGYVPTTKPTKEGNIDLPIVDINSKCDIKLSIQYDKKVKEVDNSFNLHTGLLPKYGGMDVLDHAIRNKEKEQGLTFHKMTRKFDHGPSISKITYPIFPEDKTIDLYKRLLSIGPNFLLQSLKLLESFNEDQLSCLPYFYEKPTIYKRGEFSLSDEMKEHVI